MAKKAAAKRQSFKSFVSEEIARDPEFARALAAEKKKTLARLGRPPGETKRGQREMRLLVPQNEAERIRRAAEAAGRTVSNWLLQAAREKLRSE